MVSARLNPAGSPPDSSLLASGVLSMLHTGVCGGLALGYLAFADTKDLPLLPRAEVWAAPLSFALLLGLSVFLCALLVGRVFGPGRHLLGVSAVVAGLELGFLLWDRPLFRVTRLHLDGRILAVLLQPDALENIGLPRTAVLQGLALGGLALGLSLGFAWVGTRVARSRYAVVLARRGRVLGIVSVCLLVGERLVYATVAPGFYTERSDPAILLPLGDLLGVRLPEEIVQSVFGWKSFYARSSETGQDNSARPTDIHYPAPRALEWKPQAPARGPNVVVIGIESLRSDIVTPETMPHLHQLAERSWWGTRHFSASINTHLALFSLLSGLSPNSWSPITLLHRPLFTYELLRRAGYDVTATSSQRPTWFGLERTVLPPSMALARAPAPGSTPDPDAALVDALQGYLEHAPERPFFTFLFFNGTHFPYLVPPGGELFQPSASSSFDMADPRLIEQRDALFNRYRNAVHHVDEQVGRVLALLRARGLEQDTLVVVTGDHGESFWDDGRFSHTSLLSRAQLQVPLVMFLPGRGARRLETLSHHTDVMPTLLDAVGISLPPELYADGQSLLHGPPPRAFLSMQFGVEGPSDYAFIDDSCILRFHLQRGSLRATGGEWIDGRPMDDAALHQSLTSRWGPMLGLLHDANRWLPGASTGPVH